MIVTSCSINQMSKKLLKKNYFTVTKREIIIKEKY